MEHTAQPHDLGIADRLRRTRGRPGRRTVASTKVTKREAEELEAAAKNEGKVFSEWAREILLAAARGARTDVALFTEVTALRLLLTNVLRPIALGQTITPEAFQAITAGVRSDKHDAAQQLLEQYQPSRKGDQ